MIVCNEIDGADATILLCIIMDLFLFFFPPIPQFHFPFERYFIQSYVEPFFGKT